MKKRSGYSLIEMLVVIAGSGVVLATATALLHSMFQVDRTTRDHAAGQQTLRRLADDFRDDVHAAVKLAVEPSSGGARKPAAWELQMPQSGHNVRYEAVSSRLVRVESLGGKMVRREVYRLPDGATATIRLESGTPPIAVLRIAPAGPPGTRSNGLPFRIEAALASDHRFTKAGGK